MKPLVFIEHDGGEPCDDALAVLAKAAGLFGEADAVVCGSAAGRIAGELSRHGATRVIVVEDAALDQPTFEPYADALEMAARHAEADVLLFATSVLACDLAAALAARLEAGICWGMVDLELRDGTLVGKRPTEMDTVLAEVAWATPIRIGLFRFGALRQAKPPFDHPATARIEVLHCRSGAMPRACVAERRAFAHEGPPLAKADVIVSAGRGIGAPEKLDLIRELATLLGGVPGVSLPLVDMGWAPRSMQVGQTGTIVKPRLYVACGISGQIQHMLGIEQAETIVAINRDAGAPIMSACDLGVVADVRAIVPALIELLKRRDENASGEQNALS